MRTLTLIALGFGLASVGTLFLAIATDYWLFTSEPVDFETMILDGQSEVSIKLVRSEITDQYYYKPIL